MTTNNTPTSTAPNFGLDDPADNLIAAEIAGKDPVRDIKGPVSLIGGDNIRVPQTVPLSALSPDMQAPILAKLQGVSAHGRAAAETRLVAEALRSNSINLRVMAGGGENADPYWRETLSQENEQRQLQQSIWQLEQQLAEVVRWDVVNDPATGAQTPKAVERIQGDRRNGMIAERNRLQAQIDDLNGRGGQLRLQKAMQKAVDARKDLERQLNEDAEAKQRGDDLLREERVAKRAETYAKHRRNTI